MPKRRSPKRKSPRRKSSKSTKRRSPKRKLRSRRRKSHRLKSSRMDSVNNPDLITGIPDNQLPPRARELIYLMKGFLIDQNPHPHAASNQRVEVSMELLQTSLWFDFKLTYRVPGDRQPYYTLFVEEVNYEGESEGPVINIRPNAGYYTEFFGFIKTQLYGIMADIFVELKKHGFVRTINLTI